MSATIEGAVKALLEEGGFGLAVYRGKAPVQARLPYVEVSSVASPAERTGDLGDDTAVPEVRDELDVSLWQAVTDPATGRVIERYGLAHQMATYLRGRTPQNVLDRRVYPLVVNGVTRVPVPEDNTQRESISVTALRQTGGTA